MQNIKTNKKLNPNQKLKSLKLISSQASLGFSLIELLVVVAIMLVVTSATLLRQSKFSSDILVTNMAYEIALDIREAGVLGIGSKRSNEVGTLGFGGSTEDQYRIGYGVHFSMNPSGLDTNRYIKFIDLPDAGSLSAGTDASFNYIYDDGFDPTTDDPTLAQGRILRFCGLGHGSSNCVESVGDTPNVMDIVFVKPNPDAHITMGTSELYDAAIIVVQSALGDKCRTIRVFSSGQVAIDTIHPEDTNAGCDKIQ